MEIGAFIKNTNANKKVQILNDFFRKREKVLDFGCGDLSLASFLKQAKPLLSITGVDVVNFGIKPKGINFLVYNGKKLPFKNNSFDTTLSFYVLHHCKDAKSSFSECVRVTKKRLIIVESVVRNRMDLPFMKFIDWLSNIWKGEKVSLTYQFLSYSDWRKLFKEKSLKVKKEIKFNNSLSIFPFGQSYVFELIKKNSK